mgnify:CR=1 FL=1
MLHNGVEKGLAAVPVGVDFLIPVGLLAVILGFSLWAGRYVELRTEHWSALLENAGSAAQMEDWDSAWRTNFPT